MMVSNRVRMLPAIGLCVSIAILISACGNNPAPATPPAGSVPSGASVSTPTVQPKVASGKLLFESHCAVCHGQFGEGGKAPDGSIATPLSSHLRAHAGLEGGVQQIVRAVLDGVHEEEVGSTRVLADAMPRFRDKLSEAEVTEIISYMETLP